MQRFRRFDGIVHIVLVVVLHGFYILYAVIVINFVCMDIGVIVCIVFDA